MRKSSKMNLCSNAIILFVQVFFLFVLFFSIIRYCDPNIPLSYFFHADIILCVIGSTSLILWVTGSFRYAKGLFKILFEGECPNEKCGLNVLFFLRIVSFVSIVVNLIITTTGVISAGHDLQTANSERYLYVFAHHMAYLAGSAYYGLFVLIFLFPFYMRVKKVVDGIPFLKT